MKKVVLEKDQKVRHIDEISKNRIYVMRPGNADIAIATCVNTYKIKPEDFENSGLDGYGNYPQWTWISAKAACNYRIANKFHESLEELLSEAIKSNWEVLEFQNIKEFAQWIDNLEEKDL